MKSYKMLVCAAVLWLAVVQCQSASIDGRHQPKFEYDSGENGHEYISFNYGSNGVYKFAYQLRDQSRFEERDEDGEVRGAFSFVDPEGEHFSLQYLANRKGFQPTADHLPKAPEETEDVKEAREAFKTFYEDTVKYLEALSSSEAEAGRREYERRFERVREGEEEDDDDSSSEEDEEEEDDDEVSSEEDDDDEDSDENDGDEESSENGDDEEDSSEEEEQEDEEGATGNEEGGEDGEEEGVEKSENKDRNDEQQSGRRRSDNRRKNEAKRKNTSKSEKRSRGSGKYKA